jgi:hypothetical protein
MGSNQWGRLEKKTARRPNGYQFASARKTACRVTAPKKFAKGRAPAPTNPNKLIRPRCGECRRHFRKENETPCATLPQPGRRSIMRIMTKRDPVTG